MVGSKAQSADEVVLRLAGRQHGVIARRQLLDLGLSPRAIEHRLARGRLHVLRRGIYVVGRPETDREGRWMAAVLAAGPGAVLSHGSAAAIWGIAKEEHGWIDVSVPFDSRSRRQQRVRVHRRYGLRAGDLTHARGIPVTAPVRTLVDMAVQHSAARVERAVNEADRLDLVDPEGLRSALEDYAGERGVARLRRLLDRRTFRLTDSELERWFLPQVRQAGLPLPLTGQHLNGFKVDFYWPDLRLVVETDGLRYHRTPAQQAQDRIRDQAHLSAGFTPLRFTHWQVRHERAYVRKTLLAVARRLQARSSA
jgi:very-short-patch-repair endonuclease